MKILQVALGVGASAGGPVRSITGLTRALSFVDGCDVTFFLHNPIGIERFEMGNAHVVLGRRDPTKRRDESGDFEGLLDALRPDIVHFHGIWSLVLHDDQIACRRRNIPYVVAPRGSLDEWSLRQKALKKKVALFVFQRKDLNGAAGLHVTAKMEEDHCRRLGLKGPYLLSPNGVNLPAELPPRRVDVKKHRALFMSRMHPKKGVIELVKAWSVVRPKDWVCELVYTLNGGEERTYESEVKAAVASAGLSDSFVFTGALDDVRKWEAYRRSDVFVLPTYTENFGIVIAEALYAEVPVLTTRNAPWKELVEKNCGWWINLDEQSLETALRTVTATSVDALQEMGLRGASFVKSAYSWDRIACNMVNEYRKTLEGLKGDVV